MIGLLSTYLRPYRRRISIVVVLLFFQAIVNLYLPGLNADIINNGVAKGDTGYILTVGGWMLAVTLASGVAAVVSVYHSAKVAMGFGRDLRSSVFRTVGTFSQREVNIFGAPSLITRNTNDVQQLQMLVFFMLNLMIIAPITAVGGIVMALRQDVPLSSVLVVILPVMGILIGSILRFALPHFKQMQVRTDAINKVVREKLSGIRVIRAFVRNEYEERRFDEANDRLTDTALQVARIQALMIPSLMAIMNLSSVAIMWFGGIRVESGAMPIGDLTAFLSYVIQILFSVMMATIMFVMVPRAAVSADRIGEVLGTVPSVKDPAVPAAANEGHGSLSFEDVSFRYPGAEDPVLCGVSFDARPGEITAVIGSTGSGKSTLINLIPRLYDVTEGVIRLDGTDIRDLLRSDLWARIGFVPQKAFLFSGTVASNLRYGKEDATDDELWHALEVAQARGFVEELPEGLDSAVAQGGTNFSGGQRQRLAIARALIRRPEVYVFDDSFSALDFKTDSMLRAALRREITTATTVIVAQRVSTIMHADRIIVLDAGRIVGMGTHHDLLETTPTYREIVSSQLALEESA